MLKQTIVFANPAYLSLKNNQLVIQVKGLDDVVTRPIEDIGVIIVENQQVHLTVPLLNFLVENNVCVVFCDSHYMPRSMLMNINGNSTLQEAYRYQFEASAPARKNVWKQLVESKIRNQSALLFKYGLEGDKLKPFYMNVKSGDTDNREGAAARIYWQLMFGDNFTRDRDADGVNALLNYGYTILRAAVARALIGSGLYPAFGVFHRNRYNAFPLADDVMEPYRAFVDDIVLGLMAQGQIELDKETKMALQRVLLCDVYDGKQTRPLQVALTMTTASLLKFFKGDVEKLSLPILK